MRPEREVFLSLPFKLRLVGLIHLAFCSQTSQKGRDSSMTWQEGQGTERGKGGSSHPQETPAETELPCPATRRRQRWVDLFTQACSRVPPPFKGFAKDNGLLHMKPKIMEENLKCCRCRAMGRVKSVTAKLLWGIFLKKPNVPWQTPTLPYTPQIYVPSWKLSCHSLQHSLQSKIKDLITRSPAQRGKPMPEICLLR